MSLRLATSTAAVATALWASLAAAAPLPPLPVVPPSASKLAPIELSELVYRLLPPKGAKLGGGGLRTLPAVAAKPDPEYRSGLALRVRVEGVRALVLSPTRRESAWTLSFRPLSPRDPPITLSGGVPPDMCFGARFSGCGFSEGQMLSDQRLKWRLVCSNKDIGRNWMRTYKVTAPGKSTVLISYAISEGSGGSSIWADFYEVADQTKACTRFNP